MERRYKAFISYSWADKAWGDWLHTALETYTPPKAVIGSNGQLGQVPDNLRPIFKDREEEAAGHGIAAAIEAALGASDFLIVICSPHSAKSKWVNREVAWFKTNRSRERIIALVVDGEPCASISGGDPSRECFPATLLYKVDANLEPTTKRTRDDPLAADARKSGDGRRGAKLKIAAALLGLGLDDLIRRDNRRRAIRRRVVTSGAVGLSATMSVLTFVALDQRDAAEMAEAEAVKARIEAEDHVEFMISDMREPLEAVGRLDILEMPGKRALDYYAARDLTTAAPDELARRARAQLLVGEVNNLRGDLTAALASYSAAAKTTEEQLRRAPNDAERVYDHAQSEFWVGYIAWRRGDLATTERYWTEYLNLALRLVDIEPENNDYQAELLYAHSNLGTLALDTGQTESAITQFEKSLTQAHFLLDQSPDDPSLRLEVAQSQSWLASALSFAGAYRVALDLRREELANYAALLKRDTRFVELAKFMSAAHEHLAVLSALTGDLASSARHANEATRIANTLGESDSENADFIDVGIQAHASLGEVTYYQGDYAAATAAGQSAYRTASALLQTDPTVKNWRTYLIRSALLLSRVAHATGAQATARTYAQEAIDALRIQHAENSADLRILWRLGEALVWHSTLTGDVSGGASEAIALMTPRAGEVDLRALVFLGFAYLQTDNLDGAEDVLARLAASEYRHPEYNKLRAAINQRKGKEHAQAADL